jgi:hypothetical protein|tara:strand:+ start:37202 stop:37690 length:489 start_codon:yes stop_codon:yes gene_type:complete
MSRFLFLLLNILAFKAAACSFAPAFDEFVISENSSDKVTTPTFRVDSIHRGTDDGNHGSCSDAGFINLKLEALPSHEQGYIFKIVEGKFEDQLFYESPVVPSKFMENEKLFSFLWLDGSNKEQEPINITVQIIAVSRSGNKSEPQRLKITHPGIQKPWWKVW